MERNTIITADGSSSVAIPSMNVTYHSVYGAIRESSHVFVEAGLNHFRSRNKGREKQPLAIFEMGFGTGLNALLTLIESEHSDQQIFYETIELYPLEAMQIASLNYCSQLNRNDLQRKFVQMHEAEWGEEVRITPQFILRKSKVDLLEFQPTRTFEVIYFDAFDPGVQPDLWSKEVFRKMFSILEPGGILVTYSSKGDVRRAMILAGFEIEKIPGPPGKREMIRAARQS